MKKIALLILTTNIAFYVIGQTPGIFDGKYLVTGNWIVIEGIVGYKGLIEPIIVTVTTKNEQIMLMNYSGIETNFVLADVKSDSFLIPIHYSGSGESTSVVYGKGRFNQDTLIYQYILGGTFGIIQFDCTGIKQKENSLNYINNTPVLRCFPNPTKANVFVDLDIPSKVHEAALQIYKENGELVKNIKLTNRNRFKQTVDMLDMESGLYFGQVILDKKRQYYFKVMKSK